MAPSEQRLIDRRQALGGVASLAAATFCPGFRSVVAGEAQQQRVPYNSPEYRADKVFEYYQEAPICRATRFASGIPATCTTKLQIDGRGSIIINSMQFLDSSGWMRGFRESSRRKMPTIANAEYSDPDIVSTSSSGVLMTVPVGNGTEDILISNEHALRAARWELETKGVYDWHYDVGVLPAKYLLRDADDRTQLPKARLADRSIANNTICSKKVEVVGFGSDLFKFVGQPFKLPYYVTEGEIGTPLNERQHLFFGLRIPNGFLRDMAEIGGMSGSPVVLEGSRDVVGIVTRVGVVSEGDASISYLVFTGPDQVRAIVERSRAAFAN
jgi:hypothetical protein